MSGRQGAALYEWKQPGYQPLVFSHDWQVAMLNWEPMFDLGKDWRDRTPQPQRRSLCAGEGPRGIVHSPPEGELRVEEMVPGVIYNVPQGSWHNLLATRDASWIIVENRGTHLDDTELRPLNGEEMAALRRKLPDWAKG